MSPIAIDYRTQYEGAEIRIRELEDFIRNARAILNQVRPVPWTEQEQRWVHSEVKDALLELNAALEGK